MDNEFALAVAGVIGFIFGCCFTAYLLVII